MRLIDMINAQYGISLTAKDVDTLGVNVLKVERDFNMRAGFTNHHDRLPEFFEEEINPANGQVFDVPEDTLRRESRVDASDADVDRSGKLRLDDGGDRPRKESQKKAGGLGLDGLKGKSRPIERGIGRRPPRH